MRGVPAGLVTIRKRLFVVVASVLSACHPNNGPSARPLEVITPIASESQRLGGDPARGYSLLVNAGYISLGVPWTGFANAMSPLEARDALPGREGENALVGYSFNVATNQYGMKIASPNCLSCHASHLDGKLIVGLGRPQHLPARPSGIAQDVFAIDLGLKTADELKAFSQWGNHLLGSQEAGALMSFGTLASHRDVDTLAWVDSQQFDPSTPLEGWVDVPPWWRVKKKHGLYANGSGRGDRVRHMMNMSIVSLVDVAEAERVDAMFFDIAAFLDTLEPPRFPHALEAPLVAAGAEVFVAHCARCHGTYGPGGAYPNLLVPANEVGTDPLLAQHFWANQDAVDWFNASFFGQGARYEVYEGYVAPPLDGIWATAPFFHNGSVPTLAAVLDSSLRPARWAMSFEPADFDATVVGWVGETAPESYDTTRRGFSNSGHLYGDALSADDRRALLEYLKSL